jgi:hypothetical protein
MGTSYGLDGSLFESCWRQGIFFSPKSSRPGLECTQLPVQWVPMVFLGGGGGVKGRLREIDLSPPSRAAVCPHCLDRYKFTFYSSHFDSVSCFCNLVSQLFGYFRMLYQPVSLCREESGAVG